MRCKRCGSYAINHNLHGRDGSGKDLCDVCYWREKAEGSLSIEKMGARIKTLETCIENMGINEHDLMMTQQTLFNERRILQEEKIQLLETQRVAAMKIDTLKAAVEERDAIIESGICASCNPSKYAPHPTCEVCEHKSYCYGVHWRGDSVEGCHPQVTYCGLNTELPQNKGA